MIYIGVDPGKKGGYAIIEKDAVDVFPWDDQGFIENMANAVNCGTCVACVEKVGAHPGQGVTSMFTFGQGYGYILGVLAVLASGCSWCRLGRGRRNFR